jgi:hypothetical protein
VPTGDELPKKFDAEDKGFQAPALMVQVLK